MLEKVEKVLKKIDRTPAWLCRQAGVHKCNFSKIRKGERKLSENLKCKFADILGINKNKLFK